MEMEMCVCDGMAVCVRESQRALFASFSSFDM